MSTEPDATFRMRVTPKAPSWVWLYCLALSAGFLLICTKSSPLYAFNDWVDANSFFTMGKGMMNGKVLYRDLFEQKGPLLYFLHGIAYLVSSRSFLGVYFFQVISFSVFLLYGQRLMHLFTSFAYSLASLPFLAFIVLNSRTYSHGDSAEEFCLPLLAISLFHLLRAFKTAETSPGGQSFLSDRALLLNGVIAGCVLWIKFSLLGFWIGWMLAILLHHMIDRDMRQAVRSALFFGVGVLLATLPWIVYFGIHQAVADLVETYFLINIRYYSTGKTFLQSLAAPIVQFADKAIRNPMISVPLIAGLICFSGSRLYFKSRVARASIVICALFLFFGIYGGGRSYIYYYLIASPFSIMGFVCFERLLKNRFKQSLSLRQTQVALLVSAVILIMISRFVNHNTSFLRFRKDDLVQFQYAAVINQSPDATLLNYGFLDMGFYTTAGLTPNLRFFQKQNIDERAYPLNMAEQNRAVEEKAIEFVVMRQPAGKIVNEAMLLGVFRNYDLVLSRPQTYEWVNYDYYLFKRKAD